MADQHAHPDSHHPTTTAESSADSPRQCGGCAVCCTAMNVTALDKPAGKPCEHQSPAGCGNYELRPEVCRVWHCMWVRDAGNVFSESHRPDRLGLFFTATEPNPISGAQAIIAHQVRPNAANEQEAKNVIAHLRSFFPVRILPHRKPDGTTQITLAGQSIVD